MKLFKFILLTVSAILVTGCYTQLRYAQTQERSSYEEDGYYGEDEGYIPIDYKNYEYAERYDACDCNPYRDYSLNFYFPGTGYHSFYGSSWGYSPYFSSHYWSMSPYWRWRLRMDWGYYNRFYNGFGFSLGWGSPYYHSFYGSHYYYDPFWYGLHRPFAYNYYNFYGSGYYNDGYYYDYDDNRRYGRRSIGTDRVRDRNVRIRSRSGDDIGRVRSRGNDTGTTVRRRSSGTSRTRGTIERTRSRSGGSGSVGRSRSSGGSSQGSSGSGRSRSRDRGSLQQSTHIDSRSYDTPERVSRIGFGPVSNDVRQRVIDRNRRTRADFEQQMRRQLRSYNHSRQERSRSRGNFFDQLRKVFDSDRISIDRGDMNRSVRVRSYDRSSHRRSSSYQPNDSRSRSRSSVSRSRSSSSHSRSRGGSSRSRSRDR